MLSKSVTFLDNCNILQVRWKSLWCIHTEFPYKSVGERILKIGPHFVIVIKRQVVYFCTELL